MDKNPYYWTILSQKTSSPTSWSWVFSPGPWKNIHAPKKNNTPNEQQVFGIHLGFVWVDWTDRGPEAKCPGQKPLAHQLHGQHHRLPGRESRFHGRIFFPKDIYFTGRWAPENIGGIFKRWDFNWDDWTNSSLKLGKWLEITISIHWKKWVV